MIWVRVGLIRKKHGLGYRSTHFTSGKKKSDSGRVFFGSEIMTSFPCLYTTHCSSDRKTFNNILFSIFPF